MVTTRRAGVLLVLLLVPEVLWLAHRIMGFFFLQKNLFHFVKYEDAVCFAYHILYLSYHVKICSVSWSRRIMICSVSWSRCITTHLPCTFDMIQTFTIWNTLIIKFPNNTNPNCNINEHIFISTTNIESDRVLYSSTLIIKQLSPM